MVYSGIGPDFQVLVRRARKKAMVYTASYNEAIPVHLLVSDLASVMQEFTQVTVLCHHCLHARDTHHNPFHHWSPHFGYVR